MAPAWRCVARSRSARASPSSYLHYWQHGIARNRVTSRRVLAYSATLSARLLIPGSLKRPAPRSRSRTPKEEDRDPLSLSLRGEPQEIYISLSSTLEPVAPFGGSRPNGTDRDQLHRSYCARGRRSPCNLLTQPRAIYV